MSKSRRNADEDAPEVRGVSCWLTLLLMLVPLAAILFGMIFAAQGIARGPDASAARDIYQHDPSCALELTAPPRRGACTNVDVTVVGPATMPSPAPATWSVLDLRLTTGYVAHEDVGPKLFALAKPGMAARAQLFDGFMTRVETGGATADTPENPVNTKPQGTWRIWIGFGLIVFGFAYLFVVPRVVRKRLAAGNAAPER